MISQSRSALHDVAHSKHGMMTSENAQQEEDGVSSPQLHRSKTDRRIAGVCGGLAEHFSIDPLLVRILFLAFAGVWAYLLLWLLVPEK